MLYNMIKPKDRPCQEYTWSLKQVHEHDCSPPSNKTLTVYLSSLLPRYEILDMHPHVVPTPHTTLPRVKEIGDRYEHDAHIGRRAHPLLEYVHHGPVPRGTRGSVSHLYHQVRRSEGILELIPRAGFRPPARYDGLEARARGQDLGCDGPRDVGCDAEMRQRGECREC
jgi:hypothetical protein